MELMHLMHILAENEEDGTAISKAGFFSEYMWIVGLVLIVVGLAVMYVGLKVGKGYKFMPEQTEPVVIDDELPSVNAEIIERRSTEIPDYSGDENGRIVFKEMLIRFAADGITYEEWINDPGDFGDTVPIKYNPNNPQEFHVSEGEGDFEGIPDENGSLDGNEDNDGVPEGNKSVMLTLLSVGIIVLAVGVFVLIDGLSK
ncbi:MAG: hypothetical protein IKO27_07855 [Ruminococcus sp.]|nr:hypothetical protein [Ruminococcus sp.]